MCKNLLSAKIDGVRRTAKQGLSEYAARWLPLGERQSRKPREPRFFVGRLVPLFAAALAIDEHRARKLIPRGRGEPRTRAEVDQRRAFAARCLGFYWSPFRRLEKLIHSGDRSSRTGLTEYLGLPAEWLADSEPRTKKVPVVKTGLLGLPVTATAERPMRDVSSTGSWERWIAAVMRRAAVILAPWDTKPSYRALQAVIRATRRDDRLRSRQTRPHKAAVRVAAATLVMRFGLPPEAEQVGWPGLRGWGRALGPTYRQARALLPAFRLFRQPGPTEAVELAGDHADEFLETRYGRPGDDDRVQIWRPVIVAAAPNGAIVAETVVKSVPVSLIGWHGGRMCYYGRDWVDPDGNAVAPPRPAAARVCQVVVTDPANGHRHHLTVPVFFGLPLRPWESAARRVHAAVAWTFGLSPDEYRPGTET